MKYLFIFLGLFVPSASVYAHEQHQHETTDSNTSELRWQLEGLMSVGHSTAEKDLLTALQNGAHDPQKTGFNLQHIGLSVDFVISSATALSLGLQANDEEFGVEHLYLQTDVYKPIALKVGYFAADFGRLNADHHGGGWLDYPVVNARLLGGEGTRGTGIQMATQLPLDWLSRLSFSIQNANDESAVSFLGEGHTHGDDEHNTHAHINTEAYPFYDGVGGTPIVRTRSSQIKDLLYTFRSSQHWQPRSQLAVNWGISAMTGANRAGYHSKTYLYGTDLTVIFQLPHAQMLTWQSEFIQRHFEVGAYQDDIITIKNNTLKDSGFYSQLLYRFHPRWMFGLRYDKATGDRALFTEQRAQDDLRSDRFRISSLLTWSPRREVTFHVQHNYDDADFMTENAHTIWLGLSWKLGAKHHD
jgi:hypothetical protein